MGSLRVGHDWATSLSLFTFMYWRRKWQPTPCSCLENPRDGGAWWAAVYGLAQSWTRLKWLSSSSSSRAYEAHSLIINDRKGAGSFLLTEGVLLRKTYQRLHGCRGIVAWKGRQGFGNKALCSLPRSSYHHWTVRLSQSYLLNSRIVLVLSCFSGVWLFATLWAVACQAPLPMGFSRQEYCSGLPFPSPGNLPDLGIAHASLSLAVASRFFTTGAT